MNLFESAVSKHQDKLREKCLHWSVAAGIVNSQLARRSFANFAYGVSH